VNDNLGAGGELSPMINIKDLGLAKAANSLLKGLDTKIDVQGIGKPPG
jgi:hypothetical protein